MGLSEDKVAEKLAAMRKGRGGRAAPKPPAREPQVVDLTREPKVVDFATTKGADVDAGPAESKGRRGRWVAKGEGAPIERLRKSLSPQVSLPVAPIAEDVAEYLTEFFAEGLKQLVLQRTELGQALGRLRKSDVSWSVRVVGVEPERLQLLAAVKKRDREPEEVATSLPLDSRCDSANALRAALCDATAQAVEALGLRKAAEAQLDEAAAPLLNLPGASDDWTLPDDLWLNDTPNRRSVRQMFYDDLAAAVTAAVADPKCPRRMRATITPPELNMQMDSYRVGTLLELVRHVALALAAVGLNVRMCVQGSMGQGAFTGIPRVLSGIKKLLSMMDWQAGEGQQNEGVVSYDAEVEGPIRFGAVGAEEVKADDDVLIVIAPQSMVGAPIYDPLSAMAEAAGERAMLIINDDLADRQSSGGVMGVRGRAERIAFAQSFAEVYMCRLLYRGTQFMYPIRGAVRMSYNDRTAVGAAEHARYVLYARIETPDQNNERYLPVGVFDREPTPDEITPLLTRRRSAAPPWLYATLVQD